MALASSDKLKQHKDLGVLNPYATIHIYFKIVLPYHTYDNKFKIICQPPILSFRAFFGSITNSKLRITYPLQSVLVHDNFGVVGGVVVGMKWLVLGWFLGVARVRGLSLLSLGV